MKKYLQSILCISVILVLFPAICAARTDTVFNPAAISEKASFNGDFTVYVQKDGRWEKLGKLSYDKYLTERTLSLGKNISASGRVNVKIEQHGGGAAHIDSVLLDGKPPVQVKSVDDGLKKLSVKDSDVIDAFGKTIELVFDAGTGNNSLALAARVENTVISKVPFQFPIENTFKRMNSRSSFYTYRLNSETGGMQLDETLKEVAKKTPFFKEFSKTGSGHPSGYTYGWVWNDDSNLYVAMDFTPDNTMDGDKDYAKVYTNVDGNIREFKISVPEQKWGIPWFAYTGNVGYQHKTYGFKLPFSEIFSGDTKNHKDIQLAFAAYGTATGTGCPQPQTEITFTCPFTAIAPTIDGAASSTEWPVSSQFNIPGPIETYFYCMVDGANLYVLVDAVGDTTQSSSHDTCDECLLAFNDGTNQYVGEIYTDTGATIVDQMPTGGSGSIGFGISQNSSTNHRLYEWKVPLSTIDPAKNRSVYFASPAVLKATCGLGASMPFDGTTNNDNIWPPCLAYPDTSTFGVLQFPADDDGDGIPDAVEDAAPNGGDGNGDSIPDKYQRDVTSLPSATGSGYLTLKTEPADILTLLSLRRSVGAEISGLCQNSNVQALTEASQPLQDSLFDFLYGLLKFRVSRCIGGVIVPENVRTSQAPTSGAAVIVTVYYHGATSIDGFTYRKYGPYDTPSGTVQWYTMPGVTLGTALVNGVQVPTATFTIINDGVGDDVGDDIALRIIVDQGGIGDPAVAIPTMTEWGMMIFMVLAGLGAVYHLRRQRKSQG